MSAPIEETIGYDPDASGYCDHKGNLVCILCVEDDGAAPRYDAEGYARKEPESWSDSDDCSRCGLALDIAWTWRGACRKLAAPPHTGILLQPQSPIPPHGSWSVLLRFGAHGQNSFLASASTRHGALLRVRKHLLQYV